jgi:hypothetical protein
VEWIYSAQGWDKWQASLNAVKKALALYQGSYFSTKEERLLFEKEPVFI